MVLNFENFQFKKMEDDIVYQKWPLTTSKLYEEIIVLSDSSGEESDTNMGIQRKSIPKYTNSAIVQNKRKDDADPETNMCKSKSIDTISNEVELSSNKIKSRKKKTLEDKPEKIKKVTKRKPISPKNVQKNLQKCSTSEKCLKDVILNIDETIFSNADYGSFIKSELEKSGIAYRTKSSLFGLISWSRKIQTVVDMVAEEAECQENRYLLILLPNKFGSLQETMHDIKMYTNFNHLTVLVYGLGRPTSEQENEILEIEMYFSTFWQFVTNQENLFSYIFMATKSVAQIPYKLEQEEKYRQQNEYFDDSNKDTVKVDKTGNGLGRLWRQMLTMFPLARLETAEAISITYPTMSSVFQVYEDVADEGEKLMQNIPIRRAHGPLASVKRLGPELSRKCHNYFTSEKNVLL